MSRTSLTDTQKWRLVGVAALVVVVVAAVVLLAGDDDPDGGDAEAVTASTTTTEATSTTTEATSTTTEAPATTTTTFAPVLDPSTVAFPSPESSRSFEAPEPAAEAYATEVLGFTELVVGTAEPTGPDGAEVVVQDRADGPRTVVALRSSGTDAWFVVGSSTPDVTVEQPTAGATLPATFDTTGTALAFEGTVEVVVLSQGGPEPLGTGTVTGSGSPPPGPFSGSISFASPPQTTPGVLVYRVHSPEDGRVVQATSFPVQLAGIDA